MGYVLDQFVVIIGDWYNFHHFQPGLADNVADCSAPCGQIWPNFYAVNRLGYGYKQCEFCWGVSRYAEAVAENQTKIDDF